MPTAASVTRRVFPILPEFASKARDRFKVHGVEATFLTVIGDDKGYRSRFDVVTPFDIPESAFPDPVWTETTTMIYNIAGDPIVVYDVPLAVARWIADSFSTPSIDYIQSADVAQLAVYACRNRIADRALIDSIDMIEDDGDANIGEHLGPSSSW